MTNKKLIDEILNYVSTYYNDMLNMKQSDSDVMIKVNTNVLNKQF